MDREGQFDSESEMNNYHAHLECLAKAKALFFHQHWGQEIFLMNGGIPDFDPTFEDFINGGYLLLRTVNQLTDEEAKHILNILVLGDGNLYSGFTDCTVIKAGYHFVFIRSNGSIEVQLNQQVINVGSLKLKAITDYLKNISILLPFTTIDENGKPITKSVEEIIELGWAKVIVA